MTHTNNWEGAVRWLRSQPDKQQLIKDCYFDDPLLNAAKRYHQSAEWQSIQMLLPSADSNTALDVGAGRGIASYALAKDGFIVTALEPNNSKLVGSEAIRCLAMEAGLNIQVEEELSEQLPFSDQSFDVVFARAVLHHTSELSAACKEFFRILKPGGVLLAVREHVISDQSDLEAFYDIHPLHHQYGGENAFLLKEYTHAIQSAGFERLKVISPWHSPINFAPYKLAELKKEIATRFGPAENLVHRALKVPGIWPLSREIISFFDHRPGRLYSFLAKKNG